MVKQLRSLLLLSAASMLLAACGALNAFIPDQEVPDGVLGLGGQGQVFSLSAEPVPSGLAAPAAPAYATTFVAVELFSGDIDPPTTAIPDWVQIASINETVTLDDEVQVVLVGDYDEAAVLEDFGSFTLTGLSFSVGLVLNGTPVGATHTFSTGAIDVAFADPEIVSSGGGHTTVSYQSMTVNIPAISVNFSGVNAKAVLDFYTNLVKSGGPFTVGFTLTATLAAPGLPQDAGIVVTLKSLGATIKF